MDAARPTKPNFARQGRSNDCAAIMNLGSITPIPTEEEAAAIAAAVTMMWPQPTQSDAPAQKPSASWRFSGRWWATNHVVRRGRPGR